MMGQPEVRRARQVERVRVGEVDFFVEVADTGGPRTVGVADALSFDGVRETVEAVATELARVWDQVKPAEARVEFGLSLTAKSGRLTGLVVEGGASASLTVALTWRSPTGAV